MVWIKCQEVMIKAAMWIPIAAIIEGKGTVKGLNSYERDEKGIKMSALITCNHVDFGYEKHLDERTSGSDQADCRNTDCGRRTEKDRDRLSAPADGGPEGFSGDRL